MNALLKRSTMLFIAIGFLAATTFSSTANAHTAMKWCTNWLTDYVDSGFGEDFFPDVGASVYYDAAHTYAMVQILTDNKDPWLDVWEGELA
ncbi:MAG: hypothetical protein M0R80_17870 [Proteobacteria bacterium]|jgi:hypothetical protein|nr:hypothetical protein [Pseudomonadota bacterium]